MSCKVACCLLALASAFDAAAQTPSPLAEWQYSAGRVLEPYFVDTPPRWERMAGAVVEAQPDYEGAHRFRLQPGLVAEVRYKDLAFASTAEGIGVNLLRHKGRRAGVAITYDIGRDADQDDALSGMGDLKPAAEGKLFAEVVFFPVVLRADARKSFGGGGGWTGDLSAYLPVAGNAKYFVMVGPSVTLADSTSMRRSFGVDAGQSVRSGHAEYVPGGGLRDTRFGADASWFFGKRWMIDATGAAQWLLGDASESPLVERTQQYVLALSLTYRW
jgi:outer membrane scaffolding protein for murein synthesis (MipA/OmpV family)